MSNSYNNYYNQTYIDKDSETNLVLGTMYLEEIHEISFKILLLTLIEYGSC